MLFHAIVAAGGFAALSSAHVVITEPVPFAVPALHNGPLQPDGSDFPCQSSGGGFQVGQMNVMALGSTQPLAFMGTAVHGGGSCQVSVTYDNPPTKNSVWKVIHSIEGGCPARNTPGNLGNDPNFKVPFDYSFPVPTDIPAGNATIAWTWLNKIGNREFYMNCAPVSLTGAGGSMSNWEALPDMLVANIGNGCTTVEGKDYKYPNPGKSVQSFASGELVFPQGNCGSVARPPSGGAPGGGAPGGGAPGGGAPGGGAPGGGAPGGGAPGGGAPGGTPSGAPGGRPSDRPSGRPGKGGGSGGGAPAPTDAPSPTKPGAPGSPGAPGGGNGGVFITVTTPDSAPVKTDAPEAPDAPAQPPSGAPPATPNSGGAFPAGSTCSSEGQWNCIGGTSFQRCASGSWSAVMAVSAGTSCTPGTSSTFDVAAAGSKKRRVALRFNRRG